MASIPLGDDTVQGRMITYRRLGTFISLCAHYLGLLNKMASKCWRTIDNLVFLYQTTRQKQRDRQGDRQKDTNRYRQRDRSTDRKTYISTYRQTYRQTCRQKDRYKDIQRDRSLTRHLETLSFQVKYASMPSEIVWPVCNKTKTSLKIVIDLSEM